MYNETNTFDSFKNTINIAKNIKIKLIQNGILFGNAHLPELEGLLNQNNFTVINIGNSSNDMIITITPKGSYNTLQVLSDLNKIFGDYLYSKLELIQNALTPEEYAFYSNNNNAKYFYSVETFPMSFIIRI